MTEDLISREAALDCFHDWMDKHGDVHTPDEMAEYRAIEKLPAVTLYGYPVRHLAAIAKALEDEDITPENVANLVSQMEYIAEKMIYEFNRLGEKWMALFGEEEE